MRKASSSSEIKKPSQWQLRASGGKKEARRQKGDINEKTRREGGVTSRRLLSATYELAKALQENGGMGSEGAAEEFDLDLRHILFQS